MGGLTCEVITQFYLNYGFPKLNSRFSCAHIQQRHALAVTLVQIGHALMLIYHSEFDANV